jgi:DNA modification methylase
MAKKNEKKFIQVEVMPIEEAATTDLLNTNKHSARGRGREENSMRRRGIFRPIAAAGKGVEMPVIGAGNQTFEIANEIGIKEAIVVHTRGDQILINVRDDVAPGSAEFHALAIEDNVSAQDFIPDLDLIAQLSAQDSGILSETLKQDKVLAGMLEGMGAFGEPPKDAPAQTDRAGELQKLWQTETGQLWTLANHRLLVGDCTVRENVERLMGGERADCVMTDPPYGMNLNTDYSDMPETRIASKTYGKVEGDDKDFDAAPFIQMFDYVKEQFYWGGDYFYTTLPIGGSWIVWDKRNENSDGLVGNHFEVCWSRTNHRRRIIRVHWSGVNARNQGVKREHPTEKSIKVLVEILSDYTKDGAVVVDMFGGVGTTMVACNNLGRQCRMIEVDPKYCAVILQRFADAFPNEKIEKL